ncbi:MAG: hypothetical protein A4E28_03188 [Methanocella sp. PtaU1.Bin125]|nr:MAG: hypothetical protein A4E28_03188 [Methanocella sp. PtaU1.Bin125]
MKMNYKSMLILLVLLFLIIALSDIANAAVTPKPFPTVRPTAPPSGGGGGSYYTPPVITPSPTPSPVPPNRLDTPLPSKVNIGGVPVTISGTQVSVPLGYLFTEVIKNNVFEAPITMNDGGAAKLSITVEPSGSQTGTIKSMHLIAEKTLINGGQEIGVTVDIALAGLPSGSSISFDLLETNATDMAKVNEQLSAYSDRRFSTAPLLAFKATKNGLENGKDILGATFTFTVPRPDDFDPGAAYYVVRENDGAYDILNATLIGSPGADPLVFEVVSPRGLSTFSVVKGNANTPVVTPAPATPTPAPAATPAPANGMGGLTGILVLLGTFTVGLVAGAGILVFVLWLRIR